MVSVAICGSMLAFALSLGLPIWLAALVGLIIYVSTGGYAFFKVIIKTFRRDMIGLYRYLKVLLRVSSFEKKNETVPAAFQSTAQKNAQKACFIFEDKVWTFQMVDELSNKVANIFINGGFQAGDTVALLLDNRPEYVAIWLGLAKAGIVTALINYNVKGTPLVHSLKIVDTKAVIFGAQFVEDVSQVVNELEPSVACYCFDSGSSQLPSWSKSLDASLEAASDAPLGGKQRANYKDKMMYIYTSGTTGLPKAAIIRHSRFFFYATGVQYFPKLRPDDVLYVTLPLYHSAAGIAGIGQALIFGCTVVLRRKFSASAFWKDACRHQCTVAQYIGEICRYLLSTPPCAEERKHKIRLMYGNGLRPQIWNEFVRRFNIPSISEMYAATEGLASTMNFDGRIGAVGFVSMLAPSLLPVSLIKVEESTGQPVRDADGLCIRCQPGEPGMLIGAIRPGNPIRTFDGYADQEATKKKVARDVFRRGDAAFLSGDILEMDELGYLYFKDRTGDTFRWRGENVSTTEVEAVISNVAGLKDCAVYGVEVPGSEGRAGMAAILDPDGSLDVKNLAEGLAKVLPTYARPLFIRVVATIDLTGTYKLRKVDYQKQSFDLNRIQDDLYFLHPQCQNYVPFTAQLYEELKGGKIRV